MESLTHMSKYCKLHKKFKPSNYLMIFEFNSKHY
uniref:Uncharacterized protein n=1 Tax=Rhizophora mucronata TaxID=61149 RepID=A0A2P2NBD1_RHIMU